MYKLLVLDRAKGTMLSQFREASLFPSEWVLITDDDARLLTVPEQDFSSPYDFISFCWLDRPDLFQRYNFGIGLYRTRALREALREPRLTSKGLDLYLHEKLRTLDTREFRYLHNSKLNARRMFRYGKGRAHYHKASRSVLRFQFPKLNIRYLFLYVAWLSGYLAGLLTVCKDESW